MVTARSFRIPSQVLSALRGLCAAALLLVCALTLTAQTTHKTLALSLNDSYNGAGIQASDGNFYVYSSIGGYGYTPIYSDCPDNAENSCTFITKIAPDGTTTIFHTFEGNPNNIEGLGVSSLLEASDGNFYGTTLTGGSGGAGTIFKITKAGTLTLLYTFPTDSTNNQPSGLSPTSLIEGSDGNFYGTTWSAGPIINNSFSLGNIFKITPAGAFTILYTFTPGGSGSLYSPKGNQPMSLIEGADGTFYGTTLGSPFNSSTAKTTGLGTIFSFSPTSGLTMLHNFAADGTEGYNPGQIVQGPDGSLYGATVAFGYDYSFPKPDTATNPSYGSIYKVSPTGNFQLAYTFTGNTDGWYPSTALTVGSDGNLYGTARYGGNNTACSIVSGCGLVYQMQASGNLVPYYSFLGGKDNGLPNGPVLQTSDGSFFGTSFGDALAGGTTPGSAFTLAQTPPLKAPIQITFTPTTVAANQAVKLDWTVLNAYSKTMQQCHASILGSPTGAGTWSGAQVGTVTGNAFGGSASITPTAEGTYTYVLNCGGRETGMATLIVGNLLTVATTVLPDATVAKPYSNAVLATGGTPPYTWSITSGATPSGLSFDSSTGIFSGTPDQWGNLTLGVKVKDSANPANEATGTVGLSVKSGLSIDTDNLPKAIIGANYSQPIAASGGKPPYSWKLLSGTLPDGMAFSPSTGVFSGTPTKAGSANFALQLQDSEGTPATTNGTIGLAVVPPQLTITTTQLPSGLVGNSYSQIFRTTGGTAPFTWSITSGTMPSGLAFGTGSGTISGTPLQYQASPITVKVVDSSTPQMTDSVSVTLSINSGLSITTTTLSNGTVNSNYSAGINATGGTAPYKWSVASGTLPAGLTLDGNTGTITGTPTTVGISSFSVQVLDAEGTPAASRSTFTVNVLAAAPAVSTTTLTTSSANTTVNNNVTFTATVTGTGSVPNGQVTFYNGTTSLGTATLNNSGVASLTTSFASAGSYSITANYSGNSSLTGSTSAPLTETVVAISVSASFSPSTLTITSGNSGTLTLTLTPTGGYSGTVSFSCGTLPARVSCAFAPPSINIAAGSTAPVTDTLTISTAAPTTVAMNAPQRSRASSLTAFALILPGSILIVGLRRRSRMLPRLLSIALFGCALVLTATVSGCGSESNTAKPGSYTIPVTLTISGASAQTINASVVIQ